MHFKTEILLPSATIRCTQSVRDIALRAVEEYSSLFEAYLYTVFVCSKTEHKLKTNFNLFKGHLYTKCAYSKTGFRAARRRPVARASLRSRQSSYVIPRSEATCESPKKKQKPFDDCHKPH